MLHHRVAFLAITLLAALFATASSTAAAGAAREGSRAQQQGAFADIPLLLVVTVDQMRADYLDRFGPSLTGGLRRLVDEGVVYRNALQDHAITATAPGHTAILTGLYPRDSGIVDNSWWDYELDRREQAAIDPRHQVVGVRVPESGPGASPQQLRGSSLVGWLKERDPRSQAVSIARKSRTAVLTAPEAEHVYWFHGSGDFVTSTYYRESLPEWVSAFNDSGWLEAHLGGWWELSRSEDAYAGAGSRPDDYEGERGARGFGNVFPHPLPDDPQRLGTRIQTTPFMDIATLELGSAAIRALGLGADEVTDVLALGLSSTDSIGHAFGPFSREVHDQILRLDAALGAFLDDLDEAVGLDRTLIVLTSDHGVVPLPEYSRELGHEAERLRFGDVIRGIDEHLAGDFGGEGWFAHHSYGWLHLDRAQAADRGLAPEAIVAAAADYVRTLDFVERVFTRDELLADTPPLTETETLARRSFYPSRTGDLYVVHRPLSLWQVGSAANHQSPHVYDRHVPLVLRAPQVPSRSFVERVAVVDIAPTLAALLGLQSPEGLAGTRLPGF